MNKFISVFLLITTICSTFTTSSAQEKKIKNVVLLVVPGFGFGHLSVINHEMKGNSAFSKMEKCGIVKTSDTIINSPVSSAIIATGYAASSKSTGLDKNGNKIKTILEIAAESGKSTGILSSIAITDPVNAVFYAHLKNVDKTEQTALDLFNLKPDLLIACGIKPLKNRTDNRDLLVEFRKEGYKIIDENKDFEKGSQLKTIVLFSSDHLEKAPLRGNFYEKAFQKSFKTLVKNEKGYFLLITFPQIEWACRENNSDYLVAELADLNKLIEKILLFVQNDPETLFVIVSDKETGGVSVINEEKNFIRFSSKIPTPMLIPVFANGPGAEYFNSFFSINELFLKLGNLLIR